MYEMTQGERNLTMLRKSLPNSEKLFLWCYSINGTLLASTCSEEKSLPTAFSVLGGLDKAVRYARKREAVGPLMIGTSIGLQWAVTLEKERDMNLIFVIGPVLFQPAFKDGIKEKLRNFQAESNSAAWKKELLLLIPDLPVMSYAIFSRYAVLLHNTLNGEQLGVEALGDVRTPDFENREVSPEKHDRNKVYLAERSLLQMVRNGDINYQNAFQDSMMLSSGVPVESRDPLRQMKSSIMVFTSLVCRAAMEGGLSPEVAYPLGDSYIQSAEDCRDSGELSALAHAMYHDFIYRVHHCRTNPKFSHAIQKCCDYIELSLDKKLTAADLAPLVGYSEYYLTEKFKKETGLTVSKYIRYAKIERARILLTSTEYSVNEISDQLAFNNPSFFIRRFREITGYTPDQYRKKFQE